MKKQHICCKKCSELTGRNSDGNVVICPTCGICGMLINIENNDNFKVIENQG